MQREKEEGERSSARQKRSDQREGSRKMDEHDIRPGTIPILAKAEGKASIPVPDGGKRGTARSAKAWGGEVLKAQPLVSVPSRTKNHPSLPLHLSRIILDSPKMVFARLNIQEGIVSSLYRDPTLELLPSLPPHSLPPSPSSSSTKTAITHFETELNTEADPPACFARSS